MIEIKLSQGQSLTWRYVAGAESHPRDRRDQRQSPIGLYFALASFRIFDPARPDRICRTPAPTFRWQACWHQIMYWPPVGCRDCQSMVEMDVAVDFITVDGQRAAQEPHRLNLPITCPLRDALVYVDNALKGQACASG